MLSVDVVLPLVDTGMPLVDSMLPQLIYQKGMTWHAFRTSGDSENRFDSALETFEGSCLVD